MSGPRPGMPSMDAIVDYWIEQRRPELYSHIIGWGEPFCFACDWLPPVQDGSPKSWQWATKWLDRAHLHDRCDGGPDEPSNIVPLCHLCHHDMREFNTCVYPSAEESKAAAWQWVIDRKRRPSMFQTWTDMYFRNGRGSKPSRQTTLLRARMRYLEMYVEELEIELASRPVPLVA